MLRRHHSLCSSWHLRFLFPTTKRRPQSAFQGCHGNSYRRFSCMSDSVHKLPLLSHHRHRRLPTSIKHSRNASREPVSEAQRRSAQLELEQMTQSTSRLLAIKDSSLITDAIVNEARVALHYWSRRWYMHFHPGFGRAAKGSALSLEALRNSTFGHFEEQQMAQEAEEFETDDLASTVQHMSGDYGARQAEILLDWSISYNLVPRGIFNQEGLCSPLDYDFSEDYGSSPNMTCVNIIDTYLLPCAYNGVGGFNYSNQEQISLLVEESNQRHYATLSKHYTKNPRYIKAVVDATRIMKKMRELQANFPDQLSPDTLSIKSELNVWSKRSMTLGADHVGAQTGGILAGNIIAGHINNTNPKEMLRTMENSDAIEVDVYTVQGCLHEMEKVLTRAEEQYISTKDDSIKPSVDWYNHVLGSWARSDLKDAPNRTRQILRGMEVFAGCQDANGDDDFRACWASPDSISYNSVLFCLARDASEVRAKEALQLFQMLKNRYEQTKNEDIRPDEVTYGTVLHALAQVGMAREAENILDTIEEEYGASGTVVPSLTIYNTVLNAWANSFERSAPRRAELLLARMKSLSSTGKNPDVEPDTVSISTVMSCHARSKKREGAERAEELLDQAIKSYSMGNAKVKPDSIMFNCAVLGWAHCSSSSDGDDQARGKIPAERAEMLLQKFRALRENNTLDIHPMAQTFNIVLDSWAKSERKDAASRAIALMREMAKVGVTPDECSYNSVLYAISKQEDPIWVKRAEELFQEMKTLNSMGKLTISDLTYNVMMNVHGKSRSKGGAKKAEELLRTMEHVGIVPGVISYNSCIDAYARRGDYIKAESLVDEMIALAEQGREECRPTIHSFAALVNAISNSKAPDAIDRAEDIVSKVEELGFVRPNTVLYNSLINTIVKSGKADSSERADRVLQRMEKVRQSGNSDVNPDSFAYSMVLTLCARSKEPGAAMRALNILDSMEYLYSQGHTEVVANSRCYSAVITAWARSGSPDTVKHAFALIDRMEQNKRIGSPHGRPNAHCYNACIHAVAKSFASDKVKYCLDILQRMNNARDAGDLDSAPTLVTYSTIVNACAYTTGNEEERKKAFELARTCLLTLLDSKELEPDESTFANFFLVMCRHIGKGEVRDRFAEAVFREACKQGKVERQVLYHFRNASPTSAQKLLSGCDSDVVPEDWTRNVGKFKKKA